MESDTFISLEPIKKKYYCKPPPINTSNSQSHSCQSSPSISSNIFPSHGLIKISNTDDVDSMDSFPLSIINNSKKSEADTIQNYNDEDSKSVTTSPFMRHPTFKLDDDRLDNLSSDGDEFPSIEDIPKFGIDRTKFFLDKIIDTYDASRSLLPMHNGVLLTKEIYLNNSIFKMNECILNGSVKINIIQEINEQLKKFLSKDNQNNTPSPRYIETTLHYYKKLMDAFGVLNIDEISDDLISIDNTSLLSPTKESPKNSDDQHDFYDMNKTNSPTSSSQSKNQPSHKRNDSSLLGKLKAKNIRRVSSNLTKTHTNSGSTISSATSPSQLSSSSDAVSKTDHPNRQHNMTPSPIPIITNSRHSRSVSTSTIMTNTSSGSASGIGSRSAKDQTSISEYFTNLKSLKMTINLIFDEYSSNEDEEACNKLNLMIDFVNEYILKFVIYDVVMLNVKYMKKMVKDLI